MSDKDTAEINRGHHHSATFPHPRYTEEEIRDIQRENCGRVKCADKDMPTRFVYREFNENLWTWWEVKVVTRDGEERMPLEEGVCRWCASDMELADRSTVVCMTCKAFHTIP